MVCVGIDVAKDKHDCCILDSDGTVRADCERLCVAPGSCLRTGVLLSTPGRPT